MLPGALGIGTEKVWALRRGVYLREIKSAILILYITAHQVKPQLAMFVIRATRKTCTPECNFSYTTS